MKVPIGTRVVVDLWDVHKGQGIVKYITSTMSLVRGRSDFPLFKGDSAIVIQSAPGFVEVVPPEKYCVRKKGKKRHPKRDLQSKKMDLPLNMKETANKRCKVCGFAELNPSTRFCPACGEEIEH